MDLFYFPHLSPDRATTQLALFRDVKNAAALRKRIIAASTMEGEDGEREREEVNFAFVDARLVSFSALMVNKDWNEITDHKPASSPNRNLSVYSGRISECLTN